MRDKRRGKWYRFRANAPTNVAFLHDMFGNERPLFYAMLNAMTQVIVDRAEEEREWLISKLEESHQREKEYYIKLTKQK
jgi:hypothetical protein